MALEPVPSLMRGSRAAGTVILAASLLLNGCSGGSSPSLQRLEVYAASSLTESFRELAREFEATCPGVGVSLTFAGSQVLRLQIEQGAAADVFASANASHLQALVDAGRVRKSRAFAHNQLVVIVPRDNPAGIETFRDLPQARRMVLGTPNVPVGRYARQVLHRAGQVLGAAFEDEALRQVVSQEPNVRVVRAKVELGEADAAIVYRTDAVCSRDVRLIPIPADLNVQADYFIGAVTDAPHQQLASKWLGLVTSARGRAILSRHGFEDKP